LSSNLLYVKNLKVKRNETFILDIPEFVSNEKSITGLIGNNGAGKTTFLQSILDILKFSCDELRILNFSWDKNAIKIKKNIGVYLDETYIIDYLTVEGYFKFLNFAFKQDLKIFNKRKNDLLQAFQVDFSDKQLIRDLSTGNRIKVGIIGSLLHNPKLVIWDEPFANLDPFSRNTLIDIILQFKKNGTSFIISSHNIDELYEYSDNFLCLNNGSITADDSKNNLSINDILKFLGVNPKFQTEKI